MLFSKNKLALASAAAIILATGCSIGTGGEAGGGAAATAQAPDVSSEALRAAVTEEPLRRFYEARGWQSAWSEQNRQALQGTLQNAVRHGLDPSLYTKDLQAAASPVEREVAMTRAALTYADALAHGRTDPSKLFEVYTLPRNQVDVPTGLAQAVNQGNAPQWIEALAPQDQEYQALSQAYVQHLQAQSQQQQQQQAQGGGEQSAAMAKSDGQQKSEAKEKSADEEKQNKSEAPQSVRDRAVVLAVNLERRRWLPRQPDGTRVDVNTAGTFLRYIRDNQVADQREVVVGEPGWETPQLGSPMHRLVANPDWTVPQSIEKQELADLSASELQRKNMKRENGFIVQQPGPENALGRVKFDMKNEHAIYLHDTPAKAFFQRDDRHLSHGCIRVSDALGFARMLAEQQGKLDEFNKALAELKQSGDVDPSFVELPNQIPVRLLYHTAFLDGGQLQIAEDPYGWDAKVAEALGLAAPAESQENQRTAEQKRRDRGADIGP